MLPEEIRNFIKVFSTLPSIGIRQATRLAFKLIQGGKSEIDETAKVVSDLRYLKICSDCFFVHRNPGNSCDICQNPERRKDIVVIVEKETDLISIEKTGKFKGRYLILGDLSKTGILDTSQKLRLNNLKSSIQKLGGKTHSTSPSTPSQGPRDLRQAEEIILALNPTTYGDLNTAMLRKELEGYAKKITRLGRGIPTGGEIEFADDETLRSALERRD